MTYGTVNNQKLRQRASEKRMTPLETCLVEAIVQAEAPRIRNQLPRSSVHWKHCSTPYNYTSRRQARRLRLPHCSTPMTTLSADSPDTYTRSSTVLSIHVFGLHLGMISASRRGCASDLITKRQAGRIGVEVPLLPDPLMAHAGEMVVEQRNRRDEWDFTPTIGVDGLGQVRARVRV